MCHIAILNPYDDFSQLINKIQLSIVSWEKEYPTHKPRKPPKTFYMDRKYYQNSRFNCNNNNNHYNKGNNHFYRQDGNNKGQKGKCYICQKENCCSWRYTPKEWKRSKEIY